MTLIDRETLSILNPIFKISRVQILWDDEVNEIEMLILIKEFALFRQLVFTLLKRNLFHIQQKLQAQLLLAICHQLQLLMINVLS